MTASQIALQHRGERLLCLPFRDAGAPAPSPGRGEEELEVHRLLGPERAVVVEGRDAFRRAARSPASPARHALDETMSPSRRRRSRRAADRRRRGESRRTARAAATQAESICDSWLDVQQMAAAPCSAAVRACVSLYRASAPLVIASITWSRLKLAGFWRGGNSLKLCSHWPTYRPAGTIRNARSIPRS